MARTILLRLYVGLLRPLLFALMDAQTAHERILFLLGYCDRLPLLLKPIGALNRYLGADDRVILAAGFVKGRGFEDEAAALEAVASGENIIQGWRAVPQLLGALEFGSYTRHPRMGNAGTVIWRDAPTRSIQNRIGLKNPGAVAAAAFLARHQAQIPWERVGINLALSPGLSDPAEEEQDIRESLAAFWMAGIRPAWFTLNLSCPNTEDDPQGHQTEEKARRLSTALLETLAPHNLPLWVKVSPCLSAAQYHKLMDVFAAVGVTGIIATNTLAQAAPNDPQLIAGVGGARLHHEALQALRCLAEHRAEKGYRLKIMACGGALDGASVQAFREAGADGLQYWSALVYCGLFAPAILAQAFSQQSPKK